jgi:ABC-type transport system substrate-binding protein
MTIKVLGGDRLREDVALLVAQAYRQVGAEARLEVLEWGAFFERMFHHNYDVALVAHPFPRDPDQTHLWHSREVTRGVGFNFGSYVSSQADELLDSGRTTEGCSEAARAPSYRKLSELLATDRPADFLLAPWQALALHRGVIGTAPSPFAGLYWNVSRWAIRQAGQ